MATFAGFTPGDTRTFLDTNILVYGDDRGEPEKRERCLELIEMLRRKHTGVVSIQVLQEYFVTATRKFALDAAVAKSKVEVFARFHVVEPGVADVLAAIDLHRLMRISYWDALIVRCARQAGCRVLLSEDMQHGQTLDGVRIVNPFV